MEPKNWDGKDILVLLGQIANQVVKSLIFVELTRGCVVYSIIMRLSGPGNITQFEFSIGGHQKVITLAFHDLTLFEF